MIDKKEIMKKRMREIIAELAQTVFIVFGGLCMFFSGYVVANNTGLSAILLILGMCALFIKVEYNKEEEVVSEQ